MYPYKYIACPRCKSETVLQDKNTTTGEEVFQCLDCGYYKTKSKEIAEPYGIVQYVKLSDFRKIAKTIETEEEYNSFVKPMIDDEDVIYLTFSNFWVYMINRQRLK